MYWQTAILYSGIGFVQMLLTLCTGILTLYLLKMNTQNTFKLLFYALCTGMYIWILVTALVFTQGKTVMSGTIPLILLLFVRYKKNVIPVEKDYTYSWKVVVQYTLILTMIWFWTSILNLYTISLDGKSLYLSHFDTLHSIEISQYVQKTGVETYYYWQNGNHTFPYHYAEIWLHAGIQAIWHTQKVWTWQSILVPLLQTTLIIGLLAMVEQQGKKITFYWIVLACGFMVFQGWLNVSLPHFDPHFHFTRYCGMTGAVKYVVVGILCFLYALSHQSLKVFSLLLLPIFSILTLPVVLVLAGIKVIQKRNRILFLMLLFMLLWITGFYFFTGAKSVVRISLSEVLPVLDAQFWTMQGYFILISLVFYLPVFFWVKQKSKIQEMVIIFTTGYGLFFIFYRWYDSYQFLTLFWIPFVWVSSWEVVVKSTKKHLQILLFIVMIFGFVQTVLYKKDFQRTAIDNVWLNQVYAFLDEKNLLQQGAALWYYDVRQTHVFCWQRKEYKIVSLLAKPLLADGITQKSTLDTLTAYMMQKSLLFQPQSTPDLEKQIIDFCKRNRLRFLIYPSDTLSFDAYQAEILYTFQNKKDRLQCIVFK